MRCIKISDRKAVWDVLRVRCGRENAGVGRDFDKVTQTCINVMRDVSESFEIYGRVRQRWVMFSWQFSMYVDGVIRSMKAKGGEVRVKMRSESRMVVQRNRFCD